MHRKGWVLLACLVLGCHASPARLEAPPTDAARADAEDVDPPSTQPLEIRRGMPVYSTGPSTSPSGPRQRRFFQMMLRPIEPSLRGNVARLPIYIEAFRQHCITDARLFAFDVSAREEEGRIVLDGEVEYAEHREGLARMLSTLGFNRIDNRIKLLPDAELSATPYALVTTTCTFIYDRTTEPREKMSQAIYAEPLVLLKKTGDGFYLCHAVDGYTGYVAAGDVQAMSAKDFHAYKAGSQAYLLKNVGHKATTVPTGARLHVAAVAPQKVTVQTPGGEQFTIPSGQYEIGDPRPSHLINIIIDTAMQLRDTKYVWGGKTSQGIDCSGLVQLAFKTHGINLPRDADQQCRVGSLVAVRNDRTDLRRGDLLFFLSHHGTINHVAIYLGNSTFIQASGDKVKIGSFDRNAGNYDKEHDLGFCFAKRLLE